MGAIEDINKTIIGVSKYYSKKKEPSEEHKIIYDSSNETLEPVYFWILDKMNDMRLGPKKLIDNFASSPGSGHFSEMGMRATKMQEEAMKLMQTSGVLIKSIINIIYDLKEFEIRLSQYDKMKSKDKDEAEAAMLALKQIWMDNVDMKRGAGSINAMSTGNLNFVTLRDAFMSVKDESLTLNGEEIDLNDRVKRILKPRIQEFLKWKDLSEKELRKRYEIEKTYMKNQLNSLKLYSRWAKPYLKAALQLENKDSTNPALVTAFNTTIFELTLLGQNEIKMDDLVASKDVPLSFKDLKKRKYYSVVLIDLYFRGIPQKVGQNYVFGGRAEVTFRGYALNEEELALFNKKMDNTDINDSLKLITGMTDDSIKSLQEDIEYFLKDEKKPEKKTEEKKVDESDSNPFAALFDFFKKDKKEDKKKEGEITEVKEDDYVEKYLRVYAEKASKETCFTLFDLYKKTHGMASHPHDEYEPGKPGLTSGLTKTKNWMGI